MFPLGTPERRSRPRCGVAPESLFRRAWTCPTNTGYEDDCNSDSFVPRALAMAEAFSALWLRGAPSRDHAHLQFVGPSEEESVIAVGGVPLSRCCDDGRACLIFGDGPRERVSSDPHCRRCGPTAIALCRNDEEPWVIRGGASSCLAGQAQTVPRAELTAFALALERSHWSVH